MKKENARPQKDTAQTISTRRTALGHITPPGAPYDPQPLSVEVTVALKQWLSEASGSAGYTHLHNRLNKTHDCRIRYKPLLKIARAELITKLRVPRKSHRDKIPEAEILSHEELAHEPKTALQSEPLKTLDSLPKIKKRFCFNDCEPTHVTVKGAKTIEKVSFRFEIYYLYGATNPLEVMHSIWRCPTFTALAPRYIRREPITSLATIS